MVDEGGSLCYSVDTDNMQVMQQVDNFKALGRIYEAYLRYMHTYKPGSEWRRSLRSIPGVLASTRPLFALF